MDWIGINQRPESGMKDKARLDVENSLNKRNKLIGNC